MAKMGEVYKCETCGIVVEVCDGGPGQLVCCGEQMNLMEEKTADTGKEKHVPVLESQGTGSVVKVGSVPHPMEEDHYIEWVEVVNGDWVNVKMLHPGDKPEAEFYVAPNDEMIVRAYCNKHGLWRA